MMPNAMSIRSGECKKFSPNIFNKTKCTNCFKQKEEHSAEALESNRATRKVAKCGYLFVAPGWDFSNPINRTKRWQRRWFVLYDDGELSYSLDEHPETIPQACIDMNKVIDVTEAEELTGNPYSLAITTHDEVHFVKATSREETKWWMDVLSVFSRSKGRHKRNATFPVIKSSVTNAASATNGSLMQPSVTSTRSVYFEIPKNTREQVCAEEKSRSRCSHREKRSITTTSNYSEDLGKLLSNWHENKSDRSRRLILEEFDTTDCGKLKDVTDSLSRPQSRHSTSSFSSGNLESLRDVDVSSHKQVRGDPDGCGLDLSTLRYSPTSELRVGQVSEDLLNIKKGWLMKQGSSVDQDWNKYWFVLRGAALLYYRDPTAEDQGILDGVIDLSVMSAISEVQVARNYGFQIKAWDNKLYMLSAVTAGIRANWMSAIKRAAGLQEDAAKIDSERELLSTARSMMLSSDDEYRTASENGRQSSSDWGETLPPSPPLNRTPISRVKERARGVTRTRLYNSRHSKSSPPSSRRSTMDPVRHQDILNKCTEVQHLPDKGERSSMMKKLEKQAIELEEVKRQLTGALRQLSSAEEELLRLRQRQADVATLEKQMEDTMQSLRRAEDLVQHKNSELMEYESFRKRYLEEKSTLQNEIRATEYELHESEERYSELRCELASSRQHVEQLRNELASVSERLARGIEENDSLYRRVRELEDRGMSLGSTRETGGRSLDSLSDLTKIDFDMDFSQYDKERISEEYEELRARFEKAVHEIRAMKKELRESNIQNDCLEISLINARQDLKCKQQSYESQAHLMAARIQDLTNKLSNAEKQVRLLKQKLSKSEIREKRRSLSLKGRESFAICKELEDKLMQLEKRISLLDQENSEHFKMAGMQQSTVRASNSDKTLMSPPTPSKEVVISRFRRKSLDSATGSEPMKILIRMNSLEAKVADASRKVVIKSPSENLESTPELEEPCDLDANVVAEIKNIENLLQKKLVEIYARQKSLQENDSLTDEVKLNIMAEKLAYESILVCRLQELAASYNDTDIADAERLMLELDKKLNGENVVTKSPFEYFAKSLSRYLCQMGRACEPYTTVTATNCDNNRRSSSKRNESLVMKMLQKKSNALTKKVDEFISCRMEELSTLFVNEKTADIVELVKETANKKLIQIEVSQIMKNCVDNYVPQAKKENAFECLMIDRANLEQWYDSVHKTVKHHVENALSKLKEKCKEKLDCLQADTTVTSTASPVKAVDLEKPLQQFVDIIGHKCLLDARLQIIEEKEQVRSSKNRKEISKLDEAAIMSEVQYLYTKIQRDLKMTSDERKIFDSLDSVGTEVSVLQNSVEDLVRKRSLSDSMWDSSEHICNFSNSFCDSTSSQSSWLEGVCKRCFEIKEQIINLQTCLMQSQECQKCSYLQEQLNRKESEFEEAKQQLENQHSQELEALKLDLENERNALITRHEEETNALRERANKFERRLSALDLEYAQQMDSLRSSYQRTPSPENDRDSHCSEESVRQRYQTEIEQLRALCEKGLVAMDNSHKRIITELEEKHRQEIESMKLEKDQALAEETQATLAALDAMRKAHEAEVQKEIVKFKTEYSKKVQSSRGIGTLHKEHEAEMEEIRREILTLSEKYSIKCVESATLEEELRITNNQLAQAQHHIMQLDNRNKQLRAHLISDTNDAVQDEELLLQLEERTNQISSLQEQLSAHDDTLNTLCAHLGNGDLDYSTLTALLEKLQLKKWNRRIDAAAHNVREEKEMNFTKNRIVFDSSVVSTKLKRCQSKRSNSQRSPSPSSVSGMVAERKKIFEP